MGTSFELTRILEVITSHLGPGTPQRLNNPARLLKSTSVPARPLWQISLGVENILECLAVENEEGQPFALLAGGLTAALDGPLAELVPGRHVAFRSSSISLSSSGAADGIGKCHIRGIVVESSYYGDGYRLKIETGTNQFILATVNDSSGNLTQEKYLGEVLDFSIEAQEMFVL